MIRNQNSYNQYQPPPPTQKLQLQLPLPLPLSLKPPPLLTQSPLQNRQILQNEYNRYSTAVYSRIDSPPVSLTNVITKKSKSRGRSRSRSKSKSRSRGKSKSRSRGKSKSRSRSKSKSRSNSKSGSSSRSTSKSGSKSKSPKRRSRSSSLKESTNNLSSAPPPPPPPPPPPSFFSALFPPSVLSALSTLTAEKESAIREEIKAKLRKEYEAKKDNSSQKHSKRLVVMKKQRLPHNEQDPLETKKEKSNHEKERSNSHAPPPSTHSDQRDVCEFKPTTTASSLQQYINETGKQPVHWTKRQKGHFPYACRDYNLGSCTRANCWYQHVYAEFDSNGRCIVETMRSK
jgi:hypothetical protein